MTHSDTIAIAGQQALWAALLVGGPLLAGMLVIGVAVALVQALTQVQEASLAFVPKIVLLGLAMLLGGPAAMGVLRAFALTLFDRVVAAGGAP
ncbi:MAG: flagellar biosynthetic protein FliQ [Acetobacteraceae bacterium]|nr:flagellar biosynthetic protein FliQ [Acetobacteraceae bacterium]